MAQPAAPLAAVRPGAAGRRHLLVLQHGLWGTHRDWERVVEEMAPRLGDSAAVMVHATAANERNKCALPGLLRPCPAAQLGRGHRLSATPRTLRFCLDGGE